MQKRYEEVVANVQMKRAEFYKNMRDLLGPRPAMHDDSLSDKTTVTSEKDISTDVIF